MSDRGPHQEQLAADLATLREIRERADHAIAAVQRSAFDARAEEVQEAVKTAVEHLYFYSGGHGPKGAVALARIVMLLAPEVHTVLEEGGPDAAYRVVVPDEEDGS